MANNAQPVCVLALQRRNKSELGPLRTFRKGPKLALTVRVRALIVRRPPPPKHVCRGVPFDCETAVSAPL